MSNVQIELPTTPPAKVFFKIREAKMLVKKAKLKIAKKRQRPTVTP